MFGLLCRSWQRRAGPRSGAGTGIGLGEVRGTLVVVSDVEVWAPRRGAGHRTWRGRRREWCGPLRDSRGGRGNTELEGAGTGIGLGEVRGTLVVVSDVEVWAPRRGAGRRKGRGCWRWIGGGAGRCEIPAAGAGMTGLGRGVDGARAGNDGRLGVWALLLGSQAGVGTYGPIERFASGRG